MSFKIIITDLVADYCNLKETTQLCLHPAIGLVSYNHMHWLCIGGDGVWTCVWYNILIAESGFIKPNHGVANLNLIKNKNKYPQVR